jgi:hypothetical protein
MGWDADDHQVFGKAQPFDNGCNGFVELGEPLLFLAKLGLLLPYLGFIVK